MMKIDIKSDLNALDEYINEMQKHPLLQDVVVDVNNVNDYALFIEEHNNCIKCSGLKSCCNTTAGFTSIIENGSVVAKPCKYKKDEYLKAKEGKLIRTLFVSKSILNADLVNFNVNTENRKKIYQYLVNFIDKTKNNVFEKGLYIYGGFSTGKTFILGCIANELARNNIESLIIYFPDLVVELKNSIGTPRFEELINYLKSVDVLMLDDFGSENMTNWLRDEILGPVINYRLMEEKPLFISSNVTPDNQLLNHVSITKSPSEVIKGNRIISRIEGLTRPIELDNLSYKR